MPPLPVSMGSLAEQATKLLDFNQKLDIDLLDNVVGCLYTGEGQQVRVCYKKTIVIDLFVYCIQLQNLVCMQEVDIEFGC